MVGWLKWEGEVRERDGWIEEWRARRGGEIGGRGW